MKSFLSTSKFYLITLLAITYTLWFLITDDQVNAVVNEPSYQKSYEEFYPNEEVKEIFYTRLDINEKLNKVDSIEFYNQFTNNTVITTKIIENALEHNIPVNIAFSISWKESKFKSRAVGYNNNGTTDIGLFQLNNRYHEANFDIEENSHNALSYLNQIMDRFDDDIIYSLYAYNAGQTRVAAGDIPDVTLEYAEEVLQYEAMLDEKFNELFELSE